MAEGLLLYKPTGVSFLFFLFPESTSLKIRIVLLRLHFLGIIGTGGLYRGIEHIGRNLYRRFARNRQHPMAALPQNTMAPARAKYCTQLVR